MSSVSVIGAGPAGLMAAETLSHNGIHVDVYDAMPSMGRKFLMAGKGGMNITHAEPYAYFLSRYGTHRPKLEPFLNAFTPDDLRRWIATLGIETFVGSSGRVFPGDMKAAPLLRAWLHRLRESGVQFHSRHCWQGWQADGSLSFTSPLGEKNQPTDAVILALGGGSWPQLGSNGAWIPLLAQRGVDLASLRPANCGFEIEWSAHFRERFVGQPLKSIAATFEENRKLGECMITAHGIEGGVIYTHSAAIRDTIEKNGSATLFLDLIPDWTEQRVRDAVHHPRGSRSLSSHLQSRLGLHGVKANLLREILGTQGFNDPALLSHTIKAVPLKLIAARPLSEAISSAGGVKFSELNEQLMLKKIAGVFCCGEMLDWEAPTGGYLLSACFATGRAAGQGAIDWLKGTSKIVETYGIRPHEKY
ncbi:MAG: TIGR03862 family flavoprotein [Gallionellaceae bacterium]